MSEIAVAMTTEIEPPPAGKKQRKPRNKNAPPRIKHGISRPYRTLPAEVLAVRTSKLTTRLEKAKRQHECTRLLLTKYAHESFYRDREAVEAAQAEPAPPGLPALRDELDPPPTARTA